MFEEDKKLDDRVKESTTPAAMDCACVQPEVKESTTPAVDVATDECDKLAPLEPKPASLTVTEGRIVNASKAKTQKNIPKKRSMLRETVADLSVNIDPFIGKKVTFGCQSAVVMDLKELIRNKFYNNGIWFDIDPKYGHIFGTVMRVLQARKGDKSKIPMYNVVWEYTAYGERELPMSVLLDAHKVAESVTTKPPANCTRQ